MGKPGWSKVQSSPPEYIGRRKRTRGSETSQYPEEKKSNEIPLVAASERGLAQTGCSTNCTIPNEFDSARGSDMREAVE